ncbi:hypothetical protein P7C70_g3110, partial [Phenoliferia sp. Uapishka_3]
MRIARTASSSSSNTTSLRKIHSKRSKPLLSLNTQDDADAFVGDVMHDAPLNRPLIYDVWSSRGDLPNGGRRNAEISQHPGRSTDLFQQRIRHDVNGVRVPALALEDHPTTCVIVPHEYWPYPPSLSQPLDDMHVTWSPELQACLVEALAREAVDHDAAVVLNPM